ncbi:MAG: 16S rRNA (uracil(1498)-N(3))-methyltransferase [Actinobacteria bacterium]|nr:MAG: 16S rRNA (uracil(1498)-N(3))-methyltransferase [Actinomycetota bacterium]
MSGHAPFFFAEPGALDAAELTIEGEDARHLAVVRRASPGDLVRISDGRGTIADARLTSVTPAAVGAEVLTRTVTPAPSPRIEVHQGLAKGDKVDGVIRHLVEMGVDRIVVFEAGRSVARWDGARQAAAGRRWATIAREAAKQSHRAWLPVLDGPVPEADAAASASAGPGLGLVAHPAAGCRLRDVLEDRVPTPGGPESVWVVVGPEGGLSEDEVATFAAAGAVPVSLGPQILRTETASVVAAALVLHHFGRLG